MKSFKQHLNEMAQDLGPAKANKFVSPDYREIMYDNTEGYKHHSHPVKDNKDIELLSKTENSGANGEKVTKYITNDNKGKETLHRSDIVTREPTKALPFKHDEQTVVARASGGKLPKGYAEDVTYKHFENSEHPLRSSDMQYTAGHNMWKNLVHKALADGHHVYHHNGKRLIETDKGNAEEHLAGSFGVGSEFKNKHMILSKSEL